MVTTSRHLAPPWYSYPGSDASEWEELRAAALGFAVVNVASGPGESVDDHYAHALRAGSATPFLGYVPIDYGRRHFRDVRADVSAWMSRYGVTGIFLDEVPSKAVGRRWSLAWIEVLRADGVGMVAINPGTTPEDAELMWAADVTCVFEGAWESYRDAERVDWLHDVPAERQWHLVHSVPARASLEIQARALASGAAFSWATRGRQPHPWGQGWEDRGGSTR